jgi:ferredoxin-NADP reductase
MSNLESKLNILNSVRGYQQGIEKIHAREKVGTNKLELKGKLNSEIAKLHPKRLNLKVVKIIQETETTKTFRFSCENQQLPVFQAGQYINLFLEIKGVHTARPYAISSCPTQKDYYDLTIKKVNGGFVSTYLLSDTIQVGDQFSATSPMGSFYYNPLFHGNDLVFVAGGSGVAPARSMIKSVLNRGLDINFHLIFCNSFETDVIFIQELRQLAEKFKNFKLTEVISRPSNSYKGISTHISKELLSELIEDVTTKTFYVCGPTLFNEFCKTELRQLNVQAKRIRIECNGPPMKPSALPKWPQQIQESDEITVTVKGRGQFKARVGEPLLNSLERNGYSVENACRSGECSLCRVKVLSGNVFNPPEAKLRKSDKDFGWVHSCVAFPTEDIEILY